MTGRSRLRLRTVLLGLVTCAVLAYAMLQGTAPEASSGADDSEADETDDGRARILDVKPLELSPGAAIIVYADALPDDMPVSVTLAKKPAEILHREAGRLVVRVPHDTPYGQAKLRVVTGDKRSKPFVLTLRPLPRDTMLRGILGGLAVFVIGLGMVGRALRAYAGRRVRAALSLLTRGRVRPALVGSLLGLSMQSTTSVAGLLGGLSGARMLTTRAAVTLLVGALLGTAVAAVLFPLLATREALWIVCIGVVVLVLAESRTSRALGLFVVGAGLLFHGLALLQSGFAPLVSDPEALPYLAYFRSDRALGLLRCVATGAALTGVLQGPSAVFALVLSVAQSTGLLPLRDGLAILCGVSLGAVVGSAAAAWPFGRDARRMVAAQALLALAMTGLSVAGLPLWTAIAESVVAADGPHTADGGSFLSSHVGLGLGVGFVTLQLAAALLAVPLVPLSLRIVEHMAGGANASFATATVEDRPPQLTAALSACQRALAAVREVAKSGDRAASPLAEAALAEVSAALHALLAARDAQKLRPATVACLQLQSAIESALRIAEKAPEHGFSLSGPSESASDRLHTLTDAALSALVASLASGTPPNLTDAQAREIELNAIESETRRKLFDAHQASPDELPALLWASELCAAYELVGNQLYRVASALAYDSELD